MSRYVLEENENIFIIDSDYPYCGYIVKAAFEESDWSYDMIKDEMQRMVDLLNKDAK